MEGSDLDAGQPFGRPVIWVTLFSERLRRPLISVPVEMSAGTAG
jgi:hypothetical protein